MRVLIVGGGSAGWIVAATLQHRLNGNGPAKVAIGLVESPDISRIGVGEATIPTVRNMLRGFGLPEAAFMRSCEATFKHAIRFDDWSEAGSSYLHPFHRYTTAGSRGAAARWLSGDGSVPFADLVSCQGKLIAAGRAPRMTADPDYGGDIPYAYHLDAEMFADMLADHCAKLGVTRNFGHVKTIEHADDGRVNALGLSDGRRLTADLFIDCSGFGALLSPEARDPDGWIDQSEHLLCDRAVVFRVPGSTELPEIAPAPFTRAKALTAGWCWDIGLLTRRGRGYVYSSKHISDENAEAELRADEGPGAEHQTARCLQFRVGRLAAPWRGNVVAIGLSAGFLEPLESTGLYMADFAARSLSELFPPTPAAASSPALAWRYNELVGEVHDSILDFITLHYTTAGRRDTEFWRDASDPQRCPERLSHLLSLWELRPPSFADFSLRYSPFNHVNYEYILLGSGWRPASACRGRALVTAEPELAAYSEWLTKTLPSNGEALHSLHDV